mmetsp:Transcript_5331/g.10551  ORF Transcript_5331/g.10551 Transcript_5331/m.10551 type:complete len:194 (-) Transcript_5331:396-977(-)
MVSSSSKPAAKKAAAAHQKKSGRKGDDSSDESSEEGESRAYKREERNRKEELIADILCRWWFCMDPWPPENFKYAPLLEAKGLKEVSIDDWEETDDVTGGKTKVYQVSHFPGVFRDPSGKAHDFRPTEGKPCYNFLDSKSEKTLFEMLIRAYTHQMKELEGEEQTKENRALMKELEGKRSEREKAYKLFFKKA